MKISEHTVSAIGGMITGDGKHSPFYRSGPELVNFFNQFGWNDSYGPGFPSRWFYAEQKIREANGTSNLDKIIIAAVDPRSFLESECTVEESVEYLNQFLIYDGYKLVKSGLHYDICKTGTSNAGDLHLKNLIFAANGPKPEIVLEDATTNDIKIVKNAKYCLVYDREFSEHGLLWGELVDWWCDLKDLAHLTRSNQRKRLYTRLKESLDSDPERVLFDFYYRSLFGKFNDNLPALVPQVYLHYDPYTLAQLEGKKRLPRQRMDFLLLLPSRQRIVIEIDGKQHYSSDNKPSPTLYADMVSEDRRLMLAGYEVYRFGGYEFLDSKGIEEILHVFFERLFQLHSVEQE